jgi:heavy metal sensor kinase
MTIRLRLTLWYTALLGATLIFFSVVVYSALSTNLQAQLVQESQRQAWLVRDTVRSQIEQELASLRAPELIALPDLNYFTASMGVQVINRTGGLVKKSDNLAAVDVELAPGVLPAVLSNREYVYTTTPQGVLVYSVPLMVANQIIGAVQVIRPVAPAQNALSQVSRYLILGTGLSLVVAAVVGAFLARRELAPLAKVTQTASSINRAKDLDLRIDIQGDDSEIGELAETFNEMMDRIQQLFTGQERLVADVSHDLRTPLTTIQGNMELLRRMATAQQTPGQQTLDVFAEIMAEVENETERMSEMINDLLLLAQADSGMLKLQMERVEMDTLLLEVYRQTRRMAEHKKGPGALDVRLGTEDQAVVRGDPERLRQLLLNLTDNAIKYTPAGGAITLSLENSDGWVRIAVQDTGIGISPEQQGQIFERFYRTDKARGRGPGGSGLGLSIVQWIANAHSGHVTVESAPGQGSTFTLHLPEYAPAAHAPGSADGADTTLANKAAREALAA